MAGRDVPAAERPPGLHLELHGRRGDHVGRSRGINDTQWKNFAGFAAAKQCEFDKNPGGCKQAGLQGKGLSFWSLPNGVPSIDEPHAAQGRMQKLLQMFKEKFPQFEELPEPFSSVPGQVCG